jgi:hypothetical protein
MFKHELRLTDCDRFLFGHVVLSYQMDRETQKAVASDDTTLIFQYEHVNHRATYMAVYTS